ncbi:MAG TPA: alpha/beta hydrolase [Rhizomicrobium sp.]|nr:alpha/beta hydrolase [Rhizomicrobium sp.]
MASFESGGVSLAYDDIGRPDRPCVILVHGFATNRGENWRRLGWYGAFERKGFRCVALDCRGHGESAKPHEPALYASAAMTGDIFALMDHLQIARADVMGYSMGARLALSAALARPERIANLVLGGVGAKLFDPPLAGHPMADAMATDSAEAISEPVLKSFRHFADEQGGDRGALSACARGLDFHFTRDMLGAVRVPTLVVAGARDALAGDPGELAAAIPGARAVTLPGCDHFSAIPHGLFKASVIDFLEGVLE